MATGKARHLGFTAGVQQSEATVIPYDPVLIQEIAKRGI
jgi:hypothetical protein